VDLCISYWVMYTMMMSELAKDLGS